MGRRVWLAGVLLVLTGCVRSTSDTLDPSAYTPVSTPAYGQIFGSIYTPTAGLSVGEYGDPCDSGATDVEVYWRERIYLVDSSNRTLAADYVDPGGLTQGKDTGICAFGFSFSLNSAPLPPTGTFWIVLDTKAWKFDRSKLNSEIVLDLTTGDSGVESTPTS